MVSIELEVGEVIVMGSAGRAGGATMAESFHRRIRSDILARIASGEWPPGHRLPSTPALVERYRVQLDAPALAASTVRHAISLLIESGTLRGQQGVGVFVTGEPDATPGSGV